MTDGEIIAVDGKRARGSRDRRRGRSPLHMVSAWGCRNRLVLGQEATAETSNAITAIPKLLEVLERKGAIVTIDAMGGQRAIAEQICAQGATTCSPSRATTAACRRASRTSSPSPWPGRSPGSPTILTPKDHGRLETRRYWISEALRSLPEEPLWVGLRSIGTVERRCLAGTTETVERRYFIGSIPANAVRGHWGVENRLPWRLDESFRADASRIRKGNAPAIMTAIRHLCVNLLDREPATLGLAQTRRKAACNDDYRAKVLFA